MRDADHKQTAEQILSSAGIENADSEAVSKLIEAARNLEKQANNPDVTVQSILTECASSNSQMRNIVLGMSAQLTKKDAVAMNPNNSQPESVDESGEFLEEIGEVVESLTKHFSSNKGKNQFAQLLGGRPWEKLPTNYAEFISARKQRKGEDLEPERAALALLCSELFETLASLPGKDYGEFFEFYKKFAEFINEEYGFRIAMLNSEQLRDWPDHKRTCNLHNIDAIESRPYSARFITPIVFNHENSCVVMGSVIGSPKEEPNTLPIHQNY